MLLYPCLKSIFHASLCFCVCLWPVSVFPPLLFVPMQLQDSLTSMTSSERCSISRGCERDQAGTSLSSLGHKSRMVGNRTSAPAERHPLLFALNGCCPFTYSHPSSVSVLFGFFSFSQSAAIKGFCFFPFLFCAIRNKICARAAVQLSEHITQKSKVSLMSTYVNPLLHPSFFESSLQMCTQSPSLPERYCSTSQIISGQVSRPR